MEIVLRVSWSIISGWQKRDKYSSNIVATVHTKFIKWFIDYCEIRQFAVDIFTIPHTIWTRNGIEFGKINARLFQIFEGNIRLIHLTSMLVGQQIFNKKSHSFHIYSPEEIYSRCSTSFFLLFTRKSWFYELHTIYMVFEAATTVLLWPGFSFLFSYWLFWKDFGAVCGCLFDMSTALNLMASQIANATTTTTKTLDERNNPLCIYFAWIFFTNA